MSLKVLSVTEETKKRFEKLQRQLSATKNADVSQDNVVEILLDAYSEYKEVDL